VTQGAGSPTRYRRGVLAAEATTRPDTVDALGGDGSRRRVWVVFADLIPNRVFFECGVLDELRGSFPGELAAVFLVHEKHVRPWLDHLEGIQVLFGDELAGGDVSTRERFARRVDYALDRRIGFYPLAIRHSLRHGFHRGRWTVGHSSPFLDLERKGPLPRWRPLETVMARWHLSSRRHVPSGLLDAMRRECAGLVLTNPQAHLAMPYLTGARRLRLPVVGYVASWDHPVGKGIVSPHLDRYLVQNETMREDLRRYHRIDPARVTVTGWPQTDVYHRPAPREAYEELLARLGLPAGRPVVLYAGNIPDNSPYEGNLVARLVEWWREGERGERPSLLFRPHPYDRRVEERFGPALDVPGIAVQRPAHGDFEDLATLLEHVDCVVANAGTILLEALVNDRPSICVTYDEGAAPDLRRAGLNLQGEHYRRLLESVAFYRAGSFEELVAALERALRDPGELHAERERVSREVVGEIDGRSAERVVEAVREALAPSLARVPA
jgi:CDP-Glycerol:Poly(glycerophosphate) glycerophosphotransferase